MDMTVFNVGFGQSILMEEDGHQLLVDCGSKNSSSRWVHSISYMKNSLAGTKRRRTALLTHYHVDHYRYFKEMNPHSFDDFYLPYIGFQSKSKGSILTEEALLTYLFLKGNKSDTKVYLQDQMQMVFDLLKKNGRIAVLMKGDYFTLGHTVCEVLWPSFDIEKEFELEGRRVLIDRFKSHLSKLREGNPEWNEVYLSWEETYQAVINRLYHFYELCSGIGNGDNDWNGERGGRRGRNIDQIKRQIDLDEIREMVEQQRKDLGQLTLLSSDLKKSLQRDVSDSFAKFSKELAHNFKSDNNAVSIVFRDRMLNVEQEKEDVGYHHKFLMTGDITKDKLEKYIFKDPDESGQIYNFIQCPHHGTKKTHYSTQLPNAWHFIISNGHFGNYGKIAPEYSQPCILTSKLKNSRSQGRAQNTNGSCPGINTIRRCLIWNNFHSRYYCPYCDPPASFMMRWYNGQCINECVNAGSRICTNPTAEICSQLAQGKHCSSFDCRLHKGEEIVCYKFNMDTIHSPLVVTKILKP